MFCREPFGAPTVFLSMIKLWIPFCLILVAFKPAIPGKAQDEKTRLAKTSWKAIIGTSCEKRTDGGCMITNFMQLDFGKDSVTITGFMSASCTPSEIEASYNNDKIIKKYTWKMAGNKIEIPGSYVGPFQWTDDYLVTDSTANRSRFVFSRLDQ